MYLPSYLYSATVNLNLLRFLMLLPALTSFTNAMVYCARFICTDDAITRIVYQVENYRVLTDNVIKFPDKPFHTAGSTCRRPYQLFQCALVVIQPLPHRAIYLTICATIVFHYINLRITDVRLIYLFLIVVLIYCYKKWAFKYLLVWIILLEEEVNSYKLQSNALILMLYVFI